MRWTGKGSPEKESEKSTERIFALFLQSGRSQRSESLAFNGSSNEGPVKQFTAKTPGQETVLPLQAKTLRVTGKTAMADAGYHYRIVSRRLVRINKCSDLGGTDANGCNQTWKEYKWKQRCRQATNQPISHIFSALVSCKVWHRFTHADVKSL